jgi:hypothetical protein
MTTKKTDGKTAHDECVRTLADDLRQEGWNVKANLADEEKPRKIGDLTPDIEATKGCLRRICEVVTEKDFKGDKQAYIEFKNYCDEYDFHFYVVNKNGKRLEIDPKEIGKE